MQKNWLTKINYALLGVALFFMILSCIFVFLRSSEIIQKPFDTRRTPLPKSAFQLPQQAYASIGAPVLDLHFSSPSMRLPDLRTQLIYYGKNGRPDAKDDKVLLHFGFAGTKTAVSIPAGSPLYLQFDKTQTPSKYIFSPTNSETGLWIEPSLQGNEALVKIGMKKESGELVTEPANLLQFTLPEKEYARHGGGVWELGKWRVDGTLLARQRARWYGPDLFLERHGGDEYKTMLGNQAIEFGEGDEKYTVYASIGESLVWLEDRWKVVSPGKESLGHPMLVLKKVDDRVLSLELWDVDGKGKITLNLLKSTDPVLSQNIENDVKFVGARTRSQFVFEIRDQRLYVRPNDWFLLTEEGWKKLTSPEDIDGYVNRQTPGILFVVDEFTRKDERQVLIGTVFNPSRSQMETIEIPMLSSSKVAQDRNKNNDEEESLNEDDYAEEDDPEESESLSNPK